jgi:hypothetical protein
MRPRQLGHGRDRKARGWRAADQARPALTILAALALAGCTDRWAELDPRPVVANIFGAHLEGREPPPGLDGAYPRLSSVPARPEPPDPATRARLSAALAEDRAASRDALTPAGRAPSVSGAAPPPPPRLAAMPPIRLDPAPARPEPAAMPVPAPAVPPPATPAPAAPTATPAPAALAPPPPPPRELLAPPPPPRELLAPRRD